MKKLTRKSLDELAKVMPVISEEEQRNYVGGTDTSYYYGTGYYGDTGYFGDTGYYGGSGYSDGSEYGITGYYSDAMYYSESGYSYGNYTGTVYTREEYEAMRISGSWSGGVVEGSGYIVQDTVAFSGSGSYHTMSEYLTLHYSSPGENFINAIIGAIPIFGDIYSYLSSQTRSMYDNTRNQLLQMGYNNLVFTQIVNDSASKCVVLKVYDAGSGKLITESSMNAMGWWQTGVIY
jgi:hypothetical protein